MLEFKPMKTFYFNAIKNAQSNKHQFRIMLAASQCRSLPDSDYFEICRMAGHIPDSESRGADYARGKR